MLNKELVKEVLNKLLELKDGDALPNGSGVCRELGIASVDYHSDETMPPCVTEEYTWANLLAGYGYVDFAGTMTPIRREFIYLLLDNLESID
jgi:hypothetical protein